MKKKNGKKKKRTGLKLGAAAMFLTGAAVFLSRLAAVTEEKEDINEGNKYLEMPAPDSQFGFASKEPSFYEKVVKGALDKTLAFIGLVALSPVFAVIAIAIEIDDPGPVLFRQKRIGKDKRFFELHKFRSMKMSTPHDVPTHQLEDPDQYITRVGRFLRKTSLDELPQIWDIFRGKMSIIGPRPALWNQEDLVEERDKYGANGVMPGLTGLAQISGRDELEIPAKAQVDGKYVDCLREGSLQGFLTDAKCFVGTIRSVVAEEGIVEGGTGEMKKQKERTDYTNMKAGLVSIITPCYNGARHIAETIEAVMAQTYKDWEMVIVDDGSKDDSAEIVRSYMAKDERIRLIQQENAGSAAARNHGIRECEGQYIALLDADDIWLPEFLEEQVNYLKEKDTVCVYSSRGFIDEDGNDILHPEICKDHITKKDMGRVNYIACLTGLYDASKYGKIYLHEEMKSLKDDYAYWYDIVALEDSAYGNPKVLAKYRVSSGSVTGNKKKLIKKHYIFLRTYLKQDPITSLIHTGYWGLRGFLKFRK